MKRHETQVPHACYNMCKLIVKPYVSIHLERLPGAKRGFAAAPERGAVPVSYTHLTLPTTPYV